MTITKSYYIQRENLASVFINKGDIVEKDKDIWYMVFDKESKLLKTFIRHDLFLELTA